MALIRQENRLATGIVLLASDPLECLSRGSGGSETEFEPWQGQSSAFACGCLACLPSPLFLWEMPPSLGRGRAALTGQDPCHQGRAPAQAWGLLVQNACTPDGPPLPKTGLLSARTLSLDPSPPHSRLTVPSTPCLSLIPFRPTPGPSLEHFCSSEDFQSLAQASFQPVETSGS